MAFRLRGYIAALLIFGTVTTGMLGFAGNIFDVYGGSADTSVLGDTAQDTFESTNATVQQSQDEAENIGGGIAEGLFVLKSVWNVISLTLGSIAQATLIVPTLTTYLGLPGWLASLITGILTVFIIYEIITLYRGIRS